MLSKKVLLLAAWTAACMFFPALASVDPVVRPILKKLPVRETQTVVVERQESAATVVTPVRYDDGRRYQGAVCTMQRPVYQRPVGWWHRGPVRRWTSAPVRFVGWLFRRRC